MTNRAKTILVVLVAITLAGVGYFFIIDKPASPIVLPVNTALLQTEEIDTSDWQTYRNEKLGFEIKMPKEWYIETYFGNWITGDWEFWRGQVGRVFSHGPARNENETWPYFELRVKDSNLTMEEFVKATPNIDEKHPEDIIINNLLAKRYVDEALRQAYDGNVYSEITVIKNNQRYYYFDFSTAYASSTNMSERRTTWNTIISTFRPIDKGEASKELDTSYWKTYRNEKLGFEIKMPMDWHEGYSFIGPIVDPEPWEEFWQDQIGRTNFDGPFDGNTKNALQFSVRVKDSDMSLEEFLGSSWDQYIINGLLAKHRIANQTNLGKVRFGEFIVIKNEKRFYYIEFSSGFDSDEITEKTKILWKTILMTFKPVS